MTKRQFDDLLLSLGVRFAIIVWFAILGLLLKVTFFQCWIFAIPTVFYCFLTFVFLYVNDL